MILLIARASIALIIATLTSHGRGDDNSAAKSFTRITEELPAVMKKVYFPPMKTSKMLKFESDPVYGHTALRVARLTSSNTAKITISFVLPGAKDQADDEYATISLYMSYYQSQWTVVKDECSTRFKSGAQRDAVLKLIAAVDELSN